MADQVLERVAALVRSGQGAQALTELDAALRDQPNRADWLYRRATLLLAGGAPREAIPILRRLLVEAPHEVVLHNTLGGALAAVADFKAATQAFEAACRLAPERGDYWYNLGRALAGGNEVVSAIAAFDRALQKRPGDVDILVARSACSSALGHVGDAARDLRRALLRQPHSLPAWVGLVGLKSIPLTTSELESLAANFRASRAGTDLRAAWGFAYG